MQPNYDEEGSILILPDNIAECYEIIEDGMDHLLTLDKRTKTYTFYKTRLNTLIDHCNKLTQKQFQLNIYKPIV